MKLYTLVCLIAIAACGRANDLPAAKEEAEGLVKNYRERFADLKRRADSIMVRGNAIGVSSPDAANASRMFATAKGEVEQKLAELDNAKAEIERVSKDRMEMQRYFDRMEKALEDSYYKNAAALEAIESWVTIAEQRQGAQASRAPRTTVPPPGGPGQMGAGGTAPPPVQ